MNEIIRPQPADYGVVSGMVGALCARYRFLASAPIGRSVLGRSLWGITLGSGKERVLMAAAFHGQEWLTSLVCLRLCEEIAVSLDDYRPLSGFDMHRALRGRSIVFLPLVNPDGVNVALHGSASAGEFAPMIQSLGGDEYGRWQANAHGVDLNHNFNAGFAQLQQQEKEQGITGPSARQWGGPTAESEPETKAIVALCDRTRFRHVVALHSQGEEIYWSYGKRTPSSARLMALVMASASGYTVCEPQGLASHGGFKDWFIEHTGRCGFTIELGKGRNPLPLTTFDDVYMRAREMLLLSLLM